MATTTTTTQDHIFTKLNIVKGEKLSDFMSGQSPNSLLQRRERNPFLSQPTPRTETSRARHQFNKLSAMHVAGISTVAVEDHLRKHDHYGQSDRDRGRDHDDVGPQLHPQPHPPTLNRLNLAPPPGPSRLQTW